MQNARIQIFPSLISADLLNLQKEIDLLSSHCDGFHIDVMDGNFVPNLTWGFPFIKAISSATSKPLSVHLMVAQPEAISRRLELNEGDTVAFHLEATTAPMILIEHLKKKGVRASLAIKPSTSLEALFPFVSFVDEILLMSVEPGFSGQSFISSSVDRLKSLASYRAQHKLSFSIIMDGGLDAENLPALAKHGLNNAAIASAIFSHKNSVQALKNLYAAVR